MCCVDGSAYLGHKNGGHMIVYGSWRLYKHEWNWKMGMIVNFYEWSLISPSVGSNGGESLVTLNKVQWEIKNIIAGNWFKDILIFTYDS